MSAIDDLLDRNRRLAEDFADGELPGPPGRGIAVVTCMDARIQTGAVLGLSVGEAHVIRNAGAIVTDDVLRSLTISQHKLGTKEVMIVPHTRCGMMTFDGEAFARELGEETGQTPGFTIGTFPDLDAELRRSIARVRECPFLLHTDAVRGFVYEVESGRLRELT